jgi:hypothetical protein
MMLADRRLDRIEQRQDDADKWRQSFALQYAEDSVSHRDWERQVIRDLRILCGNKNTNVPCPEDLQ